MHAFPHARALIAILLLLGSARAVAADPHARVAYRGVNLAGAEFKGSVLPGVHGKDYTYPKASQLDYFIDRGMNVFRLPFRWERLQPTASAAFDDAELARLDAFVTAATAKGAHVLLDPHNGARYRGGIVGQDVPVAAFADLWTRLATRYKGNPKVIFGLMNEPNKMPTLLWRDDANAAIRAIRATGAHNLILVPGNAWSGAHSWSTVTGGASNAEAMLGIVDPGNNSAFEVHQYLDRDSSGTSPQCVDAAVGARRLAGFTAWLKAHGKRGFLGEFAGGRDATCAAALDGMLDHIDANADVWLGWTYWAAGAWWGDYMFSVEPTGCPQACVDKPQMATLQRHLTPP